MVTHEEKGGSNDIWEDGAVAREGWWDEKRRVVW